MTNDTITRSEAIDRMRPRADRGGQVMNWQPQCDLCGRFHKCEPGSAWKMVYSGGRTRCKRCVEKHGAFPVTYCDERSKQP